MCRGDDEVFDEETGDNARASVRTMYVRNIMQKQASYVLLEQDVSELSIIQLHKRLILMLRLKI